MRQVRLLQPDMGKLDDREIVKDFVNALDFCNTCMRKSGSKPSLPIGGNTWSTIPSCSVYLDKHVISVDKQLRYFGFKGFQSFRTSLLEFLVIIRKTNPGGELLSNIVISIP